MADQEVHAITDELAQVKLDAKAVQDAVQQENPSADDPRSIAGLSRRNQKFQEENKSLKDQVAALNERLAKFDGPQQPRRVDRDDVASAIVQELADADSKVDYRARTAQLEKELEAYKVARQLNDPVAQRLIDQGIDPAKLDADLLADIRRVASESEYGPDVPHNPANRLRQMSQEEQELQMLRLSGDNPLFPRG